MTFILENHLLAHSYSHFFSHFAVSTVTVFIASFFLVWMMTLLSKTLRSLLSSFSFPLFFLINIQQDPERKADTL